VELVALEIKERMTANVRRHEIRRELDTAEAASDGLCQCPNKQGFSESRYTLYKHMSASDEGGNDFTDNGFLTDDSTLDLLLKCAELAGCLVLLCWFQDLYPR
jgi:hypothetical protein